jgi:hypothetical protein
MQLDGKVTKEQLRTYLPKNTRYNISNDLLDMINNMGEDCGLYQDYMMESFLGHIPVLRELKGLTLKTYIDAVKYCNLKQRMSNRDAWRIVFRDRYERLLRDGKEHQVDQNVAAFNVRPIVQKIDADMAVAIYIQYAPARHKAIGKAIDILDGKALLSKIPAYEKDDSGKYVVDRYGRRKLQHDSRGNVIYEEVHQIASPKVQLEAAAKIIDITAMPEERDINIKIGMSDEAIAAQQETNDKLAQIALAQQKAFKAGKSINSVQQIGKHLAPIDVDMEE